MQRLRRHRRVLLRGALMDTVTLTFTVPESHRRILDHELELLVDSLAPVLAWLERNGGHWSMNTQQ